MGSKYQSKTLFPFQPTEEELLHIGLKHLGHVLVKIQQCSILLVGISTPRTGSIIKCENKSLNMEFTDETTYFQTPNKKKKSFFLSLELNQTKLILFLGKLELQKLFMFAKYQKTQREHFYRDFFFFATFFFLQFWKKFRQI